MTKPELGVPRGAEQAIIKDQNTGKNEPFGCQDQTEFLLKCSQGLQHLGIWPKRGAVCSVTLVQIDLFIASPDKKCERPVGHLGYRSFPLSRKL